jgi:ferrochelatase
MYQRRPISETVSLRWLFLGRPVRLRVVAAAGDRKMTSKRTAVVLMNLGGPDGPGSVRPFLRNLFSDPDLVQLPLGFLWQRQFARMVADKRTPDVQGNYATLGGGSPIVPYTREQAKALEAALGEGFSVHVAMRYWHPMTEEAVDELIAAGAEQVVAVPLYPHRSRTTSHSSVKELRRVMRKRAPLLPVYEVCSYYREPGFVQAWVDAVRHTLGQLPDGRRERAHVLFSAHGLPQALVDAGDPYLAHIQATVGEVMAGLGTPNPHSLAFQSRATPVRWLEPATEDELAELGRRKVEDVVVVPIAFVTEHVETLFELDLLLKDPALEGGIGAYHRVMVPHVAPSFIETLAELVRRVIGGEGLPPCPPPCNNTLCVGKRRAGLRPAGEV